MRFQRDKLLLTVDDVVTTGYGSRATVHRHIKAGIVPAIKIGGRLLIPADEFQAVLEANRIKAGEQNA